MKTRFLAYIFQNPILHAVFRENAEKLSASDKLSMPCQTSIDKLLGQKKFIKGT